MKKSRSRVANQQARAERRANGPPKVSKYAAKNGVQPARRVLAEFEFRELPAPPGSLRRAILDELDKLTHQGVELHFDPATGGEQ